MRFDNHLYMLQRSCGELDGGETVDCNNPLQGGSDPNVLLFNHADVTGFTYGATPNLITGITLVNGKSGYLYEGFGTSVTPQQEVIKSASGQNLSKHQIGLFIFNRSQEAKNRIQKLMLGTFMAAIRSNAKDSSAWELYGGGVGLQLVPGVIQQLKENNGAYNIVLATPENQFESRLPQTIYDGTSYATTTDYIMGLRYQPAVLNLNTITVTAAGGTAMTVTGKNFYGGGVASAVTSVKWVNQSTLAETTQTATTVASDTSITFSSVALTAGTYKLKVTTSKGIAYSNVIVTSA